MSAGGTIRQKIFADGNPRDVWNERAATIFRVQILNSTKFHKLTGIRPPKSPISSEVYESIGLPYYDESRQKSECDTLVYNEPTAAASLKSKKRWKQRVSLTAKKSRRARAPKIVATTESAHSDRTYDPLQAMDEVLKLEPV